MIITVGKLTNMLLETVRGACERIGISQGAILIAFEAKMEIARKWLDLHESGTLTFTFPVVKGADTIYRKEDGEAGDCAGVAEMKVAGAQRAITYARDELRMPYPGPMESRSGALPEKLKGKGRSNWKGCVAIPIGYLVGGPCGNMGQEALVIYIAVSGGTEDEDEVAAWSALETISEIIAEEDGWMLARDYLCFTPPTLGE